MHESETCLYCKWRKKTHEPSRSHDGRSSEAFTAGCGRPVCEPTRGAGGGGERRRVAEPAVTPSPKPPRPPAPLICRAFWGHAWSCLCLRRNNLLKITFTCCDELQEKRRHPEGERRESRHLKSHVLHSRKIKSLFGLSRWGEMLLYFLQRFCHELNTLSFDLFHDFSSVLPS